MFFGKPFKITSEAMLACAIKCFRRLEVDVKLGYKYGYGVYLFSYGRFLHIRALVGYCFSCGGGSVKFREFRRFFSFFTHG